MAHLPATHEAAEAGRWGLLIAIGALVVLPTLLVWLFSDGRTSVVKLLRDLTVGTDGRVSTSKTVAVVWTYAVASALLSLVIARWLGHGQALHNQSHNGLQSQYGLLVGGPLGAAILAKGIVNGQTASGKTTKPAAGGDGASLAQLVADDRGNTDLGDLQYVLFNLVALVFFFGELLRQPTAGLPTLPDLLVGLTSVAAVGYVGKKTLTSAEPRVKSVTPATAAPGAIVAIEGTDLADGNTPPKVRFGDVASPEVKIAEGAVHAKVPDGLQPGSTVEVTLETAGGKRVACPERFTVAAA